MSSPGRRVLSIPFSTRCRLERPRGGEFIITLRLASPRPVPVGRGTAPPRPDCPGRSVCAKIYEFAMHRLEWRIKMTEGLSDWQLVLKTLKEKSGFRTDLPKGEGMGVAVVESHGTIAAACAK